VLCNCAHLSLAHYTGSTANYSRRYLQPANVSSSRLFFAVAVVKSLLLLKPQVRSVTVTVTARATGWPVMVGVVEVGVVNTRYGVSQPGADAER